MYLDDPKSGRGWKVVQTMDHRNVYAIPEQDRTDDDIDNVADQRLESLMESGAETLRDTNLIQEPFQIEGVSSIKIPIQSITIDLGNIHDMMVQCAQTTMVMYLSMMRNGTLKMMIATKVKVIIVRMKIKAIYL